MRIFFSIYQFIAPLLFLPAAYYLWQHQILSTGQNHEQFCFFAVGVPVAFGYVIPGIGTNVLKLWEFNTGFKLGAFRPHNGFVFGSFVSLMAWVVLGAEPASISAWALLRSGIILGSVYAFWGWYYDVFALQKGFISLYSRMAFENESADQLALDFAPVVFGSLGFTFAIFINLARQWLVIEGRQNYFWPLFISAVFFCALVPTVTYITFHYWKTGETGLKSFKKEILARKK